MTSNMPLSARPKTGIYLLLIAQTVPEILKMLCPPERAIMLLNTHRGFWGLLTGDVRVTWRLIYKTYDKQKCGNPEDGSGFLHGMGLAEALEPVLAKLAAVRTLDLSGMGLGNTGALVLACILRENPIKIEVLDLGNNELGEVNLTPRLIEYETQIPDVVEKIKPVLQYLHQNGSPDNVSGMEALVDVLITRNMVQKATFTLNALGNRGILQLLRWVRNTTTLEELLVCSNTPNNIDAMVPELCSTLPPSSLKVFRIDLYWHNQATPIILALIKNKTMEVLELGYVPYNESDIIDVLRQFLAENTTLKTIHIGYIKRGRQVISVQDVQQTLSRPVLATG